MFETTKQKEFFSLIFHYFTLILQPVNITGVLAKPPLTKQDNDTYKTTSERAVHAFQHPLLRLPHHGKHP